MSSYNKFFITIIILFFFISIESKIYISYIHICNIKKETKVHFDHSVYIRFLHILYIFFFFLLVRACRCIFETKKSPNEITTAPIAATAHRERKTKLSHFEFVALYFLYTVEYNPRTFFFCTNEQFCVFAYFSCIW